MVNEILVPSSPTDQVPEGAALIRTSQTSAAVFFDASLSFAEQCLQACQGQGKEVKLDFDFRSAGYFEQGAVCSARLGLLAKWTGLSAEELHGSLYPPA